MGLREKWRECERGESEREAERVGVRGRETEGDRTDRPREMGDRGTEVCRAGKTSATKGRRH